MTKQNQSNADNSFIKSIVDFLPLAIFFFVYKTSAHENPIIPATIYLVIATFITLAISYFTVKKIPKLPLFSAIILGIFGFLTVFFDNEVFIKIKPTIINLAFGIILLFGYVTKKPFLKTVFGSAIEMDCKNWLTLSLRWAIFFIFLAILNEIIWRNFPTDFWVKFKVFGMLPISFIFTALQAPFIAKHMKK
jgi:intracellular septation protein